MVNDERIEFETKLKEDADFRSEVEDIRSLLFGIETQALKEKLDEFHKDLPKQMNTEPTASKVRFLQFRKIAVAAIIILGSVSFWYFNGSSDEQLYDTYFKPDPGLPTTMSSSDDFAFYDAMVNYKQGDYKTAIKKWEVLEQKKPKNDTLTYFLGVANLANKNTSEAIGYLNTTVEKSNSIFIEDAYYYLGMAYLKTKNFEQAKKFLNLSNMDNAKKVLSKIKD